jgi:acyl-CoA synthetase (NDP forming)
VHWVSLPAVHLDSFFSPRSIAVVGASSTPGKIGAVPLGYLLDHGYAGEIYPVNPARQEIQGLAVYPSLRAIGKPVDLAIFAIPAAHADAALEDAAQAGVKNIVMFSAGFAEIGGEGVQAQERLAAAARAAGIRLLGPNCLGFMNASMGVYATFSPVVSLGLARPGPVGIASQSGAFGAYAYGMACERNVGLSTWVTTGNESDIEVADCIEWMAGDPATKVIMAYLEGCKDGGKLKRALALARAAGKPVVIVKVGRTELGAQAAASHTAALAGDDAAFDALFRQYGAWRAHTIDEFFDIAHCLAVCGLPANPKVGLLTVSGGVGVLMADDAAQAGLDVAPMPQGAQARILDRVPFAATRNPVDVTGQVTSDIGLLELAADAMLDEGGYGSLLVFLAAAGLSPAMQEMQKKLAHDLRRKYPGRLVMFSTLANAALQREMEALGCLTFPDPSRAIRVLAAMNFFLQQGASAPTAAAEAAQRIALRPGPCNEADALDLLRAHGVPVVQLRRAQSRDEAAACARELGFPAVMKVLSADILHKSDVGGVRLRLADELQAAVAYDGIHASVRAALPHARIEGVLVAPMVAGGVECILGARRDAVLGTIVMLGSGGVNVELLRDVALRIAPVDMAQARGMIGELKTAPLLHGFRGAPAADVEALAQAIVKLSDFALAAGDSLESVDLNPFAVLPRGQGAMALDAVIVGRRNTMTQTPREAVIETLPLFEMARMRAANTARRHAAGGFAGEGRDSTMRWVNQFTHTRRLRGPQDREVVTPNNDTLFTNAWLDLSQGPVVIDVPAMGERYWTLGFLDAWTNPWAYAGKRTTGGSAQRLFVHGPRWEGQAPSGMHIISAPGDDVWIIGRIIVDHDDADLARVHALQDQFTIRRLDGSPALSRIDTLVDGRDTGVPDAAEYARVLQLMLARNPADEPAGLLPSDARMLQQVLHQVYGELREAQHDGASNGGWTTAVKVRTHFGRDFLTRARVARNWIGTLGIEEAMYVMAEVDADGKELNGGSRYVLRFAPQARLQVDAFWSITLYDRKHCLLVANPIGRHSIGDRTRGLLPDADGGLSIAIQAEDPGEGRNWLPSPPGEGFYLALRLYMPRAPHLEGSFAYPPVVRLPEA